MRRNNITYEPHDPNRPFTKKPCLRQADIERRKENAAEFLQKRAENANFVGRPGASVWVVDLHPP